MNEEQRCFQRTDHMECMGWNRFCAPRVSPVGTIYAFNISDVRSSIVRQLEIYVSPFMLTHRQIYRPIASTVIIRFDSYDTVRNRGDVHFLSCERLFTSASESPSNPWPACAEDR